MIAPRRERSSTRAVRRFCFSSWQVRARCALALPLCMERGSAPLVVWARVRVPRAREKLALADRRDAGKASRLASRRRGADGRWSSPPVSARPLVRRVPPQFALADRLAKSRDQAIFVEGVSAGLVEERADHDVADEARESLLRPVALQDEQLVELD